MRDRLVGEYQEHGSFRPSHEIKGAVGFTDRSNQERFRQFVTRRSWLHGKGRLLSDDDYASLKNRDDRFWNNLTHDRKMYLLGFMDGWKYARH
jgi:hypothetical protein